MDEGISIERHSGPIDLATNSVTDEEVLTVHIPGPYWNAIDNIISAAHPHLLRPWPVSTLLRAIADYMELLGAKE